MPAPPDGTYRLNLIVTNVTQQLDGGRAVVAEVITFGLDPSDPDGYNAGWFSAGGGTGFTIVITNSGLFGKFNLGASAPMDATPAVALTAADISPAAGPHTGGTVITITGTGFREGLYVSVYGRLCSEVTIVSDTELTAVVPASGVPDPGNNYTEDVVLSYFTDMSAGVRMGRAWMYEGLNVAAISPDSGTAAGGDAVTITGTGFFAGAFVAIGGALATDVVIVSVYEITATTPAGTAGAADVVVSYAEDLSNPATLAGGFTYA